MSPSDCREAEWVLRHLIRLASEMGLTWMPSTVGQLATAAEIVAVHSSRIKTLYPEHAVDELRFIFQFHAEEIANEITDPAAQFLGQGMPFELVRTTVEAINQ